MSSTPLNPNEWKSLATSLNDLPDDARQAYTTIMHVFVHDLRQSLAQIHSAEELLRRLLEVNPGSPEILELLDVIRKADTKAQDLVLGFVTDHLEGIDMPDEPDRVNSRPE